MKIINKNVIYAILSTMLVMFILFALFGNLNLFNESSSCEGFVEGNKSKQRQEKEKKKSSEKVSGRGKKREEKTVSYGANEDILKAAPTSALRKMTDDEIKNYDVVDDINKNNKMIDLSSLKK